MTNNKIEFTPPIRPPSQGTKKTKPEGKKHVASRWQEVEEKRDPSKSGGIKNNKEGKKERFLTLKQRQAARKDEKEQSPFEMFSSFHAARRKEKEPESVVIELETDGLESKESETLAAKEEADLNLGVVPVLTAAPFQNETSFNTSHSTPVSSVSGSTFGNLKLLEFADKLVKKITVMKSSGRTEITLTLKNMSLFQGGVVKVIEHDSSRGQYNIMFSNLTQQAHALVTSRHAEVILKQSLEAKGFSFHIISATTEPEPITSYASSSHEERGKGNDGYDEERESDA